MEKYSRLKVQMRQLIRMAKEVIEEVEKTTPDDILISDIAVEEMEELLKNVSSTVLGNGMPNLHGDGSSGK